MNSPWRELGLPGPSDTETIKRAYAQRIKEVHPEEDPEGFQALHRAYQMARRMATDRQPRRPSFQSPEVRPEPQETPAESEDLDFSALEDAEEEPFDYRPARTFPVSGFEPIDDGEAPKEATCIADSTFQSEHLVVCGVIRHIQERKTQKEKPYLRFTIADATGTLSFSYFGRKKSEEKVKALQEGDSIVAVGKNELFNGGLSFTSHCIGRGSAPEGFVPEKKKSRSEKKSPRWKGGSLLLATRLRKKKRPGTQKLKRNLLH